MKLKNQHYANIKKEVTITTAQTPITTEKRAQSFTKCEIATKKEAKQFLFPSGTTRNNISYKNGNNDPPTECEKKVFVAVRV